MKKLTTLFILVFLAVGLFAEPKVPKYYFKENSPKEDAFVYVGNDLLSCYEVQAIYNKVPSNLNYSLKIQKKSLMFDITIVLNFVFETEKQLDNFCKDIHLSDIENEFNRLRKLMILNDAIPNQTHKDADKQTYDFRNKPRYIVYAIDGTKLKY